MFNYKKVGLGLGIVLFISIYVNNISMDNIVSKKIEIKDISTNSVVAKQNKKNINDIAYQKEKKEYTKVALPKYIREIENNLVDIQNNIIKDQHILNSKIKIKINSNADIQVDKKTANLLIHKMNKKLGLLSSEITKLDNSYDRIMGNE